MYRDFDEVIHSIDMPKELWEYEEIMKETPNFNKKSKFEIRKVQSRTRESYLVINNHKSFKDGHSYLKSYKLCKEAISYVEKEIIPKHKNIYFLSSLIRLSTNKKYIDDVEIVIQFKKESR